jgi:hypothetical protein
MNAVPYLVAVVVPLIAILIVLAYIALQLRELTRLVRIQTYPPIPSGWFCHDKAGTTGVAAYSVWAYNRGQWGLLTPCGQPGCDCGPPPAAPSRFDGDVLRKECPAPGCR